ncbi:MAG TPA: hypothetical protein VG294_03235 [Solirubrobacteraceae bacterium]|jgi:hypothetical protein|nr:hypothetical protein [Solirubrobacteraceae bacterium]
MNPWWLGLDPAQTTIACGEHAHRLRWEQGALRAIDHADPEAERALAALGGQRCRCVEVLDAWSRHDGDPRVLVLASRGPADPLDVRADWTAQLGTLPSIPAPAAAPGLPPAPRRQLLRLPARQRSVASSVPGWPGPPAHVAPPPTGRIPLGSPAESEVIALLGLGGGVPDRLVATVAAAWARQFEDADAALDGARATLHASMHGRLSAVLRAWLGRTAVEVELELIDARHAATLSERAGVIRAELPFAWLAEVWSRGLATIMGRFCLAAGTEDGRTWRLTTLGPDLGPPSMVKVELPAA